MTRPIDELDPESQIALDILAYGCSYVRITSDTVERIAPEDLLREAKEFLEMLATNKH